MRKKKVSVTAIGDVKVITPAKHGDDRGFFSETYKRRVLAEAGIELAHHDSDKSVKGRMFTYHRMWQALRPGGVLVSDGVGDNMGFRDFCAETGLDPVVVRQDKKYQGLLVKPDA